MVCLLPFYWVKKTRHFLVGLWLRYRFLGRWKSQNKYILFIYSESPNWSQYIEENIVPKIHKNTVFLNWSKRSEWDIREPLEAKILRHWGGEFEFNPIAIVFTPKGNVKTVRFLQAFKDLKYGKKDLLLRKESELYEYI